MLRGDLKDVKLVLVGSVRDDDDKKKVYALRLLAHDLKIEECTQFACDAPWPDVLNWLRKSWVGVNGMWNEHFGIGVVEYQAAGLICVVNDSGGPKADIVVDYDGGPSGMSNRSPIPLRPTLLTALQVSMQAQKLNMQRASLKHFRCQKKQL